MLGGGAFYRGNRDLFIVITKVRLPVSLPQNLPSRTRTRNGPEKSSGYLIK